MEEAKGLLFNAFVMKPVESKAFLWEKTQQLASRDPRESNFLATFLFPLQVETRLRS